MIDEARDVLRVLIDEIMIVISAESRERTLFKYLEGDLWDTHCSHQLFESNTSKVKMTFFFPAFSSSCLVIQGESCQP